MFLIKIVLTALRKQYLENLTFEPPALPAALRQSLKERGCFLFLPPPAGVFTRSLYSLLFVGDNINKGSREKSDQGQTVRCVYNNNKCKKNFRLRLISQQKFIYTFYNLCIVKLPCNGNGTFT